MTPREIKNAIESANRIEKLRAKEKASYDFILANLIIKGIGNVLGDKTPFPSITEAYPTIFDDIKQEQENKIQEQKDQLSALRFKQFAQSYNNRLKNKEVPK